MPLDIFYKWNYTVGKIFNKWNYPRGEKSMLKHGILGLLSYGDMTGYQIMTVFRDSLGCTDESDLPGTAGTRKERVDCGGACGAGRETG